MITTSAPSAVSVVPCTFSGNWLPGSSRPRASASLRSSTAKRSAGSTHRSGPASVSSRNSGYAVRRGASVKPRASVTSRSRSRSGQGRSGLTWSAVTGDTPPQSSMPASSSTPKSSDRFGGACRWIDGGSTSRAAAMVHRNSSGGHAAALRIPVSSLGRKFWMITSCTWPCRSWLAAIARSPSRRSWRSSPMPTSSPVVNGIWSSPAASSVARRRAGSLSGAPRWQARSPRIDSIIIPWLTDTGRSRASSSSVSAPALACGSRPVSSTTIWHMAAR